MMENGLYGFYKSFSAYLHGLREKTVQKLPLQILFLNLATALVAFIAEVIIHKLKNRRNQQIQNHRR